MNHRRFLPLNHRFRRCQAAFNGKKEFRTVKKPLSGVETFNMLSKMKLRPLGKIVKKPKSDTSVKRKRGEKVVYDEGSWKKKSIFFELEYWKHLLVRHNLDVMHIEKNVCDSVISTLLNIPGKTKDGISSRRDLVHMGIRTELAPKENGNRTYLPPCSFTLTREEKKKFCQTLFDIKVPEGYAANIRSYVSLEELKVFGLKSHDYHVLMQHLLPVAIESMLPDGLRDAVIRLCAFFNILCSKVVDTSILDELQSDIVTTLCKLEQYFPPSFFDVMIHLTVYLVRELQLCGPVYLQWMYPFERFMQVLKGYVRNRNRPEGCIVEGYLAEESVECCSEYLHDLEAVGLRTDVVRDSVTSKGLNNGVVCSVSYTQLLQAHHMILENSDLVQPFIE